MYQRVTLKEVLEENPDIMQWVIDTMTKYMPFFIGFALAVEIIKELK